MRIRTAAVLLFAVLVSGCGASASRTLDSTIPRTLGATDPISLVELEAAFVGLEMMVGRQLRLGVNDESAYVYELDGNVALDRWADVRALTHQTGYYPVLLGSTEPFDPFDTGQLEIAWQSVITGAEAPTTPVASDDFDLAEWTQRREADPTIGSVSLDIVAPLPEYDGPKHNFISHVNLFENRPHNRVVMLLVPTTSPWRVASLLQLGGFNNSPLPAEHEALHKLWFDRFGAEIVSASPDQIEMSVARPPTTDTEAIKLGVEHYLYAPDLVWQGTQEVSVLASSLVDNTSWYFWWD